jgi:hypothetical protein
MGWATVMNVPRIADYATALKWHDDTKPIRGRDPEVRPLANRKDCDTYSIRKSGDDVELVLYKTPVVTFKPNGNVELRTAGWSTVSTRQFIRQVLGISTHGEIKESIVTIGGHKHILPSEGECMTVRMGDNGWCLVSAIKPNFDYKMNRKAANNVRARYAKFVDYVDGIVRLRKDVEDGQIAVAYAEYAEAFAEEEKKNYWGDDTYKCVDLGLYTNIDHKGGERWVRDDHTYTEAIKAFLKLITSGAHDDFYKASLILFAATSGGQMNLVSGRTIHTSEYNVSAKLNEVLYKWHSDEVFDKVELPVGKLPKGKYRNWVNKE